VLRVSEVYERHIKTLDQRPDGSEFAAFVRTLDTREALVNINYIVAAYPYEFTASSTLRMTEGAFPEGTNFTTLVLDGNLFRKPEVLVVGSFEKFCQTLEGPLS
jgi:hypothetical protein